MRWQRDPVGRGWAPDSPRAAYPYPRGPGPTAGHRRLFEQEMLPEKKSEGSFCNEQAPSPTPATLLNGWRHKLDMKLSSKPFPRSLALKLPLGSLPTSAAAPSALST